MFRAILYLIVAVLLLSVVRSVMGVILRGISDLVQHSQSDGAQAAGGAQRRPSAAPSGGELKKDPVCGTFIAASTALQKKVGRETYYFCSPECLDKFKS